MQIKKELYYAKKIIKELSFGQKMAYFKNRMLGLNLLAETPPFLKNGQPCYELHVLCQKSDVWMLVWSLKSLLFHSKLTPKIVIHNDGSLDQFACYHLKRILGNIRIVSRQEADAAVLPKIPKSSKLYKYRSEGHPLLLDLIDPIIYTESEKIMVLNSDVLFFKTPSEVDNFITNAKSPDALISRQPKPFVMAISPDYVHKHNLTQKDAGYINCGITIFNRNAISLEDSIEFFEHCLLPTKDYLVEAMGWIALVGKTNFKFLPDDTYHIKGRLNENTIAKHFTSGRRHELYGYGIAQIQTQMENIIHNV